MEYIGRTELRAYFYKKQRGKCHYCNCMMTMKVRGNKAHITIDHILPKSEGGSDLVGNLVGACWPCNNMRGTINYVAFKQFIHLYGNKRSFRNVLRSLKREDYAKHLSMWNAICLARTDLSEFVPTYVAAVAIPAQPLYAELSRKPRFWLYKTRRLIRDIVLKYKGKEDEPDSIEAYEQLRTADGGSRLGFFGQWAGFGTGLGPEQPADNGPVTDHDCPVPPAFE